MGRRAEGERAIPMAERWNAMARRFIASGLMESRGVRSTAREFQMANMHQYTKSIAAFVGNWPFNISLLSMCIGKLKSTFFS